MTAQNFHYGVQEDATSRDSNESLLEAVSDVGEPI